jgi:integrase
MGRIGEGDMVALELAFVNVQRDRNGRIKYYYFRRAGRRWRLPGEPLSQEFMEEYRRLLKATEPSTPTSQACLPGSLSALAADYFASPEFRDRKPNSQKIYRLIIEPLVERNGHKPVALIERRHVKQWRDARSETPGMANMVVKVVRLLLNYAVDNEYRKDNPALRIKLFKLGEHRAWTEEECASFEKRWAPGTMQRRAYALARYTGQRRGDLAAMTRAHRRDGKIRVIQQKTGAELWITEHRELTAELARGEQGHMAILTKSSGEAFSPEELGGAFGEWIEDAGLPDECVLHGLRKTAATNLAEAGCTAHEIMAVTGHKSLSEVERYTRAASQKAGAAAAIHKLERNTKRTEGGKRTLSTSGKQGPSG